MIVTLTQHIIFPIMCRIGSRPVSCRFMLLEARLAYVRALRAASTLEYSDQLQSSGMMPDFPDISSPQPTFRWTGWDITGCYKSSVQVQPSVESFSIASERLYEIMAALIDKLEGSHMYGLGLLSAS